MSLTNDGKQETQVLHNWLWVIIPHGKFNDPLLCGYCKGCDTYFTKRLSLPAFNDALPFFATAYVPKWGCKDPYRI